MELKLTDNQVNAILNAYSNLLLFEDVQITKALSYHLKNFNENENLLDNIKLLKLIEVGEIEGQDLFYWDETPEYFDTMKKISQKLKNEDFEFNEQELYNIRNVTDLYSKMGQGHIKSVREIYSNIKNIHIGGFVSFTNIFDNANKIYKTIPISKAKEEYKINHQSLCKMEAPCFSYGEEIL